MPMTEDATAGELQPFGGAHRSSVGNEARAYSMRSGIFGGFGQSTDQPASTNISFRGDQSSRSNAQVPLTQKNELQKKLATQYDQSKESFGGPLFKQQSNTSSDMVNNANNDISIASGSDEEEVRHGENEKEGQLDQDFEFIDEVLATHMNDIQNKDAVLSHV